MPKVSVIICTQNRVKSLKDAIETVFKSPFKDYELIVVEGQSNDETHDMLVKLFLDKYIFYKYNPGNRIDGRNLGWSVANGEYICFLDDDDTQLNTRIQAQVEFLENNPDVDIVSCTTLLGQNAGLMHTLKNLNHEEITELLKENDIDDIVNFQSCMFRKSSVDKFLNGNKPFVQEAITGGEGQAFLYELLWNGNLKIANISNTVYVYRVGVAGNSLTLNVKPIWYYDNLWGKHIDERKKFIANFRNNIPVAELSAKEIVEAPIVSEPISDKPKRTRKKKTDTNETEKSKDSNEGNEKTNEQPSKRKTKKSKETPVVEKSNTEKPKRERKKKLEETPVVEEKPKRRGRPKKNKEEDK